jgi:hypothetical protein
VTVRSPVSAIVDGIYLDSAGLPVLHKYLLKPKVSNGDRYDRFVAIRRQMGTSDDVKYFEEAFQKAFKSAFENVASSGQAAACARRRHEDN